MRTPNVADDVYYTHTDYLGSILKVTNSSGNIVAQQNFDPWGRNRNPGDWTYNNIPTLPVWLYRGFTGHEHLACFALINMNARLYDPLLGRMLGPDNNVSGGTQGINRYSYANNNPLKYVDPSGNDVLGAIVGAIVGGIANTIAQGIAGHIGNFGDAISAFGSGALTGAIIGSGAVCALQGYAGSGLLFPQIYVGVASSFLPSWSFNVGSTSVTINPGIFYGTQGFGFGANINTTTNINGFQFGLSYGFTQSLSNNITNKPGFVPRYGIQGGFNNRVYVE